MGIKDMQWKGRMSSRTWWHQQHRAFLNEQSALHHNRGRWPNCHHYYRLHQLPVVREEKNYTIIIPNNNSIQINSSRFECQRATKESPFKRIKQTWRIIYDLIPICGILGVHKSLTDCSFKAWQIDGQLHTSFPQNRTINHLWLELQQERKWWKNSQNLMGWMAATLQIPRLNTSKTDKNDLCSFAPMKTFCKAPQLWRPSAKLHNYEDLNHSSAILKNLGINANGYSWL